MNIKEASKLFHDIMTTIGFSLEYEENLEGYVMYDIELGEYRGCKEEREIDVAFSAFDVVEYLETFIVDSYGDDMAHELVDCGVVEHISEVPYSLEGILNLVSEWKNEPADTKKGEFYRNHADEIADIDLIINHIDKVSLELVCSMGFGDIKQATAEVICKFYEDFTDEAEKPSVIDILKEMNEKGTFETTIGYAMDIKDWQESFKGELSRKELEAFESTVKFLASQIRNYEGRYHIIDEVKEIDDFSSYFIDHKWLTPAVCQDKSGIGWYGEDFGNKNLYRRIDGAVLETEDLSELYDFIKFSPTAEQVHEFAAKVHPEEAIFLYKANNLPVPEHLLDSSDEERIKPKSKTDIEKD